MAISATHFSILKTLKSRGILPQGGRILEIGEANAYGDFDPHEIAAAFPNSITADDVNDGFSVAKWIYRAIIGNDVSIDSIDLDPSRPSARKDDLNEPPYINHPLMAKHEWCNVCDVAYNHGTAEHIFNIAQVFRTMHDACEVGGLLIHESPFTGWLDHGFYCLQPTLFWDVAKANDYKIEFVAIEHLASKTWQEIPSREHLLEAKRRGQLADNLMLFVVMRRQSAEPFKIPMQGVYNGSVSQEATKAWKGLR